MVSDPFSQGGDSASFQTRWTRRVREQGWVASARHFLARIVLGPRAGNAGPRRWLSAHATPGGEGLLSPVSRGSRRVVPNCRPNGSVPDREILARFPRLVVPTYAGDEAWFASETFESLLPDGWPVERRDLDDLIRR